MNGFAFQWSGYLWLLFLGLPLAWLLAYGRRRRAELILALGGGMQSHRRSRDYLRLATFVFLVLALARPGCSPRNEAVSKAGRDVVFVLDISQSMLAQDVMPSRLKVSKQAVRDALSIFSNERVGLVVYAGSASIMCPLTYDYDFVRYMLDQVHTRSADFGGTTVQAAVEKVVDHVLMDDRRGFQDLVILTDGGDHGSRMERVAELLNEYQVDLLLIGIGNPDEGAPIPVPNEDGTTTLLSTEEGIVYTRLDDASLRELAALKSDTVYVPVGRRPFDLGQIYVEYVASRDVAVSTTEDGIIVYREAAVFFLMMALLLLLLSEWSSIRGFAAGTAVLIGSLLLFPLQSEALAGNLENQYAKAVRLYEQGAYVEAELAFSEVARSTSGRSIRRDALAVIEFNRGLCLFQLSRATGDASPANGLGYARRAQVAFLAAKRYQPELTRAGIRLQSISARITALQQIIEDSAKEQDALEEELSRLVERLESLLEKQTSLRIKVNESDVERPRRRLRQNTPPPPPIEPPPNADVSAQTFSKAQTELKLEATSILEEMQELDQKMVASIDGLVSSESLLAEPLEKMVQVPPEQAIAIELLSNWNTWPTARAEQQSVEKILKAILDLLRSPSSSDYEGEEYDDMEYEDFEYAEDSESSLNSSIGMRGDFAAGSEMQELPLPNYSAEEILAEEQGNQQFRQQQRARANASQVEKDY
ncbi:MAG: VWA domain-containing protein [Verrucomicrobiota bacterium]